MKGESRYTFRECCKEVNDLELEDGTEKLFFNCKYEGKDIPKSCRKLYDYIESGKATDELTEKIHEAVIKGRKNHAWRSQYMKERLLKMDIYDEGREDLIIQKVCLKLRKGKEIWQIADELEEDESRIKAICDLIESFAPDYDEEQVVTWMKENESVSS